MASKPLVSMASKPLVSTAAKPLGSTNCQNSLKNEAVVSKRTDRDRGTGGQGGQGDGSTLIFSKFKSSPLKNYNNLILKTYRHILLFDQT